jgi:hypothetical protein
MLKNHREDRIASTAKLHHSQSQASAHRHPTALRHADQPRALVARGCQPPGFENRIDGAYHACVESHDRCSNLRWISAMALISAVVATPISSRRRDQYLSSITEGDHDAIRRGVRVPETYFLSGGDPSKLAKLALSQAGADNSQLAFLGDQGTKLIRDGNFPSHSRFS